MPLWGVDDFVLAKSALERDFTRYTDDFQVEFVENCGHFIAEDRPDVVTQRALEFFAAA